MKTIFTRFVCLMLMLGLVAPGLNAAMIPVKPASTEPDAATVKAAIAQVKNMSRAEKKEKVREIKTALRQMKAEKKDGAGDKTLQIIFAILIPPLGVYLHEGVINKKFWIDLLLTILFFLPGMIYALVVVLGDK